MKTIKQNKKYNCGSAVAAMLANTSIKHFEKTMKVDSIGRVSSLQIVDYLKQRGFKCYEVVNDIPDYCNALVVFKNPVKWCNKNSGIHAVMWDSTIKRIRDPNPKFKNTLSLKFYNNMKYELLQVVAIQK